jgi:hypothetical protein
MTFRLGAATPDLSDVYKDVNVRHLLLANIFGSETPVADERIDLPPMVVAARTSTPHGGFELRLVPLASERAEIMAELVPLSDMHELRRGGDD